jgi:hypothetical protein
MLTTENSHSLLISLYSVKVPWLMVLYLVMVLPFFWKRNIICIILIIYSNITNNTYIAYNQCTQLSYYAMGFPRLFVQAVNIAERLIMALFYKLTLGFMNRIIVIYCLNKRVSTFYECTLFNRKSFTSQGILNCLHVYINHYNML